MRNNILHPGAGELNYEIRSVVEFANSLQRLGIEITWENIGDPLAKGEKLPSWIKQYVSEEALQEDLSYAYSPTKGLESARQYLSKTRSLETGNNLSKENILFFNGLGDAISKVYTWLHPNSRVMGPSPAYPTHSSIEGAHARSHHLTYDLDPYNNWLPDMEDVRNKVKYTPNITGLLIINPDNPTGMVYPLETLKEFVAIAKEYNLFLLADEIYCNLAYYPEEFVSLAALAYDIPLMIMRGLSKELPWPGSRCGWVEFYNTDKDHNYKEYAKSIEEAKMNEVCSTTLPQAVLPKILSDSRYKNHLKDRTEKYIKRSEVAFNTFKNSQYFEVVRPKGAFYLSVTFKEVFINNPPHIEPANKQAAELLEKELSKDLEMNLDKKFCLELLASTGICTVPLSSGFNSHVQGFRMTLLEEDDEKFEKTLKTINSI